MLLSYPNTYKQYSTLRFRSNLRIAINCCFAGSYYIVYTLLAQAMCNGILLIQQQKNTKEQIFEHLSLLIEQLTYSQINKDALKKWLNRKRQMVYSLLFTAYLIENKSTEINAYWELLIQRFFAAKLVY